MASSSKSSSNSTPKGNYHVFLSFRGEDTRRSFTDHLYAALCGKGLVTFRDDEELQRGEIISDSLLKAIEDSPFAIVVLSKNYASSSWCLDELQKILKSRNELGQQVFPIFYGVDPSDVRHQKGSFGVAFSRLEERFKQDQDKVQKWRDSLKEVAGLSGWDSKDRHETRLIEDVVQVLLSKLHSKLPSHYGTLVGMYERLDAIDSLLRMGSNDVRFVGIWGMGGVGKSTLASIVYERHQNQFQICCFLDNIREVSEVQLQMELFSRVKMKGMVIENTNQGKNKIQNHFCNAKILLVLDDVSSISQLENLAESKEWFGAGSRVIITTRNVHLLKSHGMDAIYKVEILNKEESLLLFSNKAFRRDQPKEGYLELSKSMVKYAGGLPLALKVLGSFLFERSPQAWGDALDKLKKVPNNDILKTLKISYEGLDEEEKTIFLDIACFFNGWNKNKVMQILINCGLRAIIGIEVLVERSLLNDGMHLNMHDLIQDMGRSIVFQECPSNASKRSRLWSMEHINQLKRNMGTEVIKGIVLHVEESCKIDWYLEDFSAMCNLRLLIISSDLNLHHGLKCLSSALKVLHWRKYPLGTLPPGTQLDQLVDLELHYSELKQLSNERQCLKNLKLLDLSHSRYLIKIPNFSELPNLEKLELQGCVDLVELHPSLGRHKKLQVLNLKGCKSLKVLPRKLEITSLKEFILCGCTQVTNLPKFSETMKNLVTLDAGDTSIIKLPESLGLLTRLKTLNLKGCKKLVCLPNNIHNLKYLEVLDICGCSKFSELPENLNENKALEKLDASGTAITILPSSIGLLEKIKTLSFHGCKGKMSNSLTLPISIFNIKSLIELDLSYCNIGDRFIPNDLGGLSSLKRLDLSGNMFVNLPAGCILNLLELYFLSLNSCPRLQSLPQPSPRLSMIDGGECPSLGTLTEEKLLCLFYSNGPTYRFAYPRWNYGVYTCGATIPGKEIPSFFENQEYLSLNKELEASIIIDVPPHDPFGFVLCTVLDDDLFYSIEPSQKNIGSPTWWFGFGDADNGGFKETQGRDRSHLREIKSPHLWIIFGQVRWTSFGLAQLRNSKQLRLRFSAGCKLRPKREVSIKCGWRVLHKSDFGEGDSSLSQSHRHLSGWHMNVENTRCLEAEEQGKLNLSVSESYQTIVNECETKSQDPSSPWLQDDHDFAPPIVNPVIATPKTAVQSPLSNCCPSDSLSSQEAIICTGDSIDGPQVPISVPKQNPSRKRNREGDDTLLTNTISKACKSDSEQTSAEEIFEELSQVSDLKDSELLHIYDILTRDESKYQSFKALPTRLRKPWILMQIKKIV